MADAVRLESALVSAAEVGMPDRGDVGSGAAGGGLQGKGEVGVFLY